MSKTYSSVWVHAVWTTKNRHPLLAKGFRVDLCSYIRETAREKEITIDMINGIEDHMHALIRLFPAQSIAGIMKQIKGASSHWINEKEFLNVKFNWQQGYGVISVSPDQINTIRAYIKNQEQHHKDWKLEDELQKFRYYNNTQ